MAEKRPSPKKISITNTKQEMLEAYNEIQKALFEKSEMEMKPEAKAEEIASKKVVALADSISIEGILGDVNSLKAEMGKVLAGLSEKLEEEVKKYEFVKNAIKIKGKELEEIYEIQKTASSLAALLEAQNLKKAEFEEEMARRKTELNSEIENTRVEWEREKILHKKEIEERNLAETKMREREKEEFKYNFAREQQTFKEKFEDEKNKLEREISHRKEQMAKELSMRAEENVQKEAELGELRKKVFEFPKELEATVNKEVKSAVERVQNEAKGRDELLRKEFEGERNVLATKIASLEKANKEQNEQVAKLSQQLERVYAQFQNITVKVIEGSSGAKIANERPSE